MIEARCPICNSVCEYEFEWRFLEQGTRDSFHVISCPKCKIKKDYHANEFYDVKVYTKEEAVNDWNNLATEEIKLLNKIKDAYEKFGNDEIGFWNECGYLITGEYF